MRYLYYIFGILFAVSVFMGYRLLTPKAPEQKAAIIVNDKVIPTETFEKLYGSAKARGEGKREFINELITRELLIQESQREGIDRDETFRRSIQNFYEQSLVKLLMDRKYASNTLAVSDDELSRYAAMQRKRLQVTVFRYGSAEEAEKGPRANGERTSGCFEDLCTDVRNAALGLSEGQASKPLKTGDRFLVVRMDRSEEAASCASAETDRERLRAALLEAKKERVIGEWLTGLRNKAFIKILVDESR